MMHGLNGTSAKRRVCIIGAGTAGLCALKNSLQHDMDATAFEQAAQIGGTWVYSEQTISKTEQAQNEIHSSMYTNLRTNLPKEVMGFPDFSYSDKTNLTESFIPSNEVLNFLEYYAQHFQLKQHIKFRHEVIRVRPKNNEWEVYVWNIVEQRREVLLFDCIFICNGHYTYPQYPEIEGMNVYQGEQLHSHLYRKPDAYTDKTVLVIGAGPSGMDIVNHIRRVAKHVYLSHHLNPAPDTKFMSNVTHKPDLLRFTEQGAIFNDQTNANFDAVIYCTGYDYKFPFLSADCGILVDDNWVKPLYKHCINLNYPTMALIGLPFKVCPTHCFDLQVRFALKFFSGQKQWPSKAEMLADYEQDMQQRWQSGLSKRRAHEMGERQLDYYRSLSELAGIENIKPVIGEIMSECGCKYIYELEHYRDTCFKVVDDRSFVKFSAQRNCN